MSKSRLGDAPEFYGHRLGPMDLAATRMCLYCGTRFTDHVIQLGRGTDADMGPAVKRCKATSR